MSKFIKNRYRKFLREERRFYFKRYTHEEVKVVLIFPNTYFLAMSNLGFQEVFHLLNRREDTYCERAFLPEKDILAEYNRTNLPLLSLESQIPIKEFDILAFSISFELDYLNVLRILRLSKIPELSSERENLPLVTAGGAVSFLNPEPMVDFIDIFFLGEAEELLPNFISRFKKIKNLPKEEIFRNLTNIEGIYIPSLFKVHYNRKGKIEKIEESYRLKRVFTKDVKKFASSSLITKNTELKEQFLIEITRGCSQGCRFCLTGFIYRPFRYKEVKDILSLAKKAIKYTQRIGLVGPNICDHPHIEYISSKLAEFGFKISTSSLKSISLSNRLIHSFSQDTITIAPECGSNSLRYSLNKEIKNEEIMEVLEEVKGIKRLKLYFMIGLPDEDIEELIEFINRIGSVKPSAKIILSINPFIPKPFTPLQWLEMEEEEILKKKIESIRSYFKGRVKISFESIRNSTLQSILTRGDRRLSKVLINLIETSNLRIAFKKAGLSFSFYRYREFEDRDILPWDHLNILPNKKFLLEEKERFLKGVISEGCPGNCKSCEIC